MPTQTITARLVDDLGAQGTGAGRVWVLDIDETTPMGLCGTAELALSDGRRIWADYMQPARLLRVVAPLRPPGAGRAQWSPDPETAAWLSDLFGPEVITALAHTESRVTFEMEPTPQWRALGRLALLTAHLRDLHQPIDGLWALDALRLIHEANLGPQAANLFGSQLAARAAPLVQHVDIQWFDSIDPRLQGDLIIGLITSARLQPQLAASPIIEHIRSRAADTIGRDLDDLVFSPISSRPPSDLVFRGLGRGALEPVPPKALIDYTAAYLLTRIEAEINGSTIEVHLLPRRGLEPLMPTVGLRVSLGGHLLAAALSTAETAFGTWRAELTLPAGTASESVVVVAGCALEMEPIGQTEFNRRQAQHLARRAADAGRRGEGDEAASLLDAAAQHLGSSDAVTLQPDGPFTAEVVARDPATKGLLGRLRNANHTSALDARRSLSWSRGDPTEAARAELDRLDAGGPPLRPHQVETLAAMLAESGDEDGARRLLAMAEEAELPPIGDQRAQ